MKKYSFNFRLVLALFVLVLSALSTHVVYAQTPTAAQLAQTTATTALQTQTTANAAEAIAQQNPGNAQDLASAAAAESAAAQAEMSAAQAGQSAGETPLAQQEAAAAAQAAQTAQTTANAATALWQANQSNTQDKAAAAAAQASAVAAENSAAQASNAAGETNVAPLEAQAAQSGATAAQQTAGITPTPATNSTSAGGSNFVPLTALPGISTVAGSTNFIALFNNLYKVCIGLAAILALLEIIWAGVIWMTAGDSSEKVGQATKKIQNAVFGLLLVLSPVIVFGIINPNVLSLNLNVSSLTPPSTPGAATAAASGSAIGTAAGAAINTPTSGIPSGQACSTANGSDGNCAGFLICTNGTCQADPQLDNGTGVAGQQCQPAAPNCSTGLICDSTDTCNAPASTAASGNGYGKGLGTVGQNGSCQTGNDCSGALVCDVLSNTCQPAGSGTFTCDDDSTPNPTTGKCADGTYPGSD